MNATESTGSKYQAGRKGTEIAALVRAVALHARAQFADPKLALDFILAGAARFTLVSRKTGTRYTYRVAKGEQEGAPHFVSLLAGSDNTSDFAFLGSIFGARTYVHGAKSKVGRGAPSARAFAWFWSHLSAGEIPESCEVWHEGRCGKCGRALTVPESVASGIGPVCAEEMT